MARFPSPRFPSRRFAPVRRRLREARARRARLSRLPASWLPSSWVPSSWVPSSWPGAHVPSGALVAGLVTAALATVGALAAEAAGPPPGGVSYAAAGAAGGAALRHADRAARAHGVPAGSGAGARVVYSVSRQEVWLIAADEHLLRDYRVAAGSWAPPAGAHVVFARRGLGRGGDGVLVEHAVLFARHDGVNAGFSAPVKARGRGSAKGLADGSAGLPAAARRGAALREGRADGTALWRFATIGRVVQVVP